MPPERPGPVARKMEAPGTLAGGIAHNFNHLLMGIHGNASLSLMGIDPSTRACTHLERINKLVESGSRLTHQLLDYASGGSCKAGSVNINGLVRFVSEIFMATKKHIRVNLRLSEDISCINAGTARPAEPMTPEAVSGKRAILLVDDDPEVMDTSSELLEMLGFIQKPYDIDQLALKVMDILSAGETTEKK